MFRHPGRALYTMPECVMELNCIKYAVTSNGAAIVNMKTGEVLYKNQMDYLTAEKIIKYGLEMDIMVEVFTNGRAYTLKRYMTELVEYGVNPRFTEWLKDTRETVESFSDILNNDSTIENINLIFSDMVKEMKCENIFLACPDVELTNSIVNILRSE